MFERKACESRASEVMRAWTSMLTEGTAQRTPRWEGIWTIGGTEKKPMDPEHQEQGRRWLAAVSP